MLIKFFLIKRTGLSVHGYKKRLISHRLNIFPVMIGSKRGYFLDPLIGLEKNSQIDRPLKQLIKLINIRHSFLFHKRVKFLLQHILRNANLAWRKGIMERNGRSVFYGFSDRVFIKIALLIVLAEYLECPAAISD